MVCFLVDKIEMIKRNLAVTAKYFYNISVFFSENHLNCAGARASAANEENLCVRFFTGINCCS